MEDRRSIRLHRCRFVDWSPSPITAIAFPPSPLPALKFAEEILPVLAIGHANGNIEIWKWTGLATSANTSQGWVLSQTFFAPRPSKVESLVFTWRDPFNRCIPNSLDGLRLFSASGGSGLLEWDLARGVVKRFLSSQGGSIWSLAANPSCSHLALGCEDGCVRLVSLQDDEFVLERKFDRVKCRILSIAWGPPVLRHPKQLAQVEENGQSEGEEEEEERWEDSWLTTGCSDSSLRKWDVRTGRVLERMSTDRTRSERTLVWAVGVLSDGTIVSGDSMGMVKFWDPNTSTQLQSFTSHGADVLCLAISASNNAVYTSGVDQKVAEFISVEVSTGKPSVLSVGKQKRWIQSCARRLHSHDVRCVAMWPPQSLFPSYVLSTAGEKTLAPLLVSGGLDMSPVFTPCASPTQDRLMATNPFNRNGPASFEEAHYHRTSFTLPVVCFSPKARLVACRYDNRVVLWRISVVTTKDDGSVKELASTGWKKILEMELKLKNNISSIALSVDGRWLAVADHLEVKLFRLYEVDGAVEPKRMKTFAAILSTALPDGLSTGATVLAFSMDSKKIIVGTSNGSLIVVLELDENDARMLRAFDHHQRTPQRSRLLRHIANGVDSMEIDTPEDIKEVHASISLLAVSPDGQWLASSDTTGKTYIFNLDSLQHHCPLPNISLGLSALSFDTKSSRYLLLCMPNNTIRLFDVEAKSFPDWQRDFTAQVSKKISMQRDPILGASFSPMPPKPANAEQSSYQSVILWGANWICRFRIFPRSAGRSSVKRGRNEDEATEEESDIKETEVVQSSLEKVASGELFLTVFTQYRHLLGVDFLDWDEMVVIERPLLDVLSQLPPAYFKAKYGT